MDIQELPGWVEPDDAKMIAAIIRLVRAVTESTKRRGMSATANREEDRAVRAVVRLMGYITSDCLDTLSTYITERT